MSGAGFTPTEPHAVMQLPTPEEAAAMGAESWMKAVTMREEIIRREKHDPLWHSFEPPIWRICDALLGLPWVPEDEAEQIRRNLEFEHPVNVLLINGAQRGSKTEYAANRISRLTLRQPDNMTWAFHNTLPTSREAQQPLFWKFLPEHLRAKPILSATTYVAYKAKTGFSDESYVLPNLHRVRFLSYDIDIDNLQGPNLSNVWTDELVDPERVQTLRARVATRNGILLVTFAPIHGYTPTIQGFWDGAKTVRESIAFLSPKDGGPKDVARYLGLEEAELDKIRGWMARKQRPPFPNVPLSRPEQCQNWVKGLPSQPAPPPGREFKMVPRVLKPVDPEGKTAIVCFHGNDNPFGNPFSLYSLNSTVSEEIANRIFYGVASKGMARKFPKFQRSVHVMPAAAIPATGTNYLFGDPADGRNFFMSWFRVTPKGVYLYREWPGNYEIPGHGVPGPWAVPHGKLGDGAPGPAQESFGFGLIEYKREIARLEGWSDADGSRPVDKTDHEWIKSWFPEHGAREQITRRFLDSRFASSPHLEDDRPVTLLENFAEMGMFFEATPGDEIAEGVVMINSLLSYDTTRPIDALNCPKLFISDDCVNTIFALEAWRGKEGRKGATKDPIDNLRYFVLSGLTHVDAKSFESEGGGYY